MIEKRHIAYFDSAGNRNAFLSSLSQTALAYCVSAIPNPPPTSDIHHFQAALRARHEARSTKRLKYFT